MIDKTKLASLYDLHDRAAEAVLRNISNLKFQAGGHFNNLKDRLEYDLGLALYGFNESELNLIIAGEKLPKTSNAFVRSDACLYCGERLNYSFDGETFACKTSCLYPGGIKSCTVELNCFSGKLVLANDLRKWFQAQSSYNICYDIGQLKTTQAYAEVGMAHGFVGNSCPSVYQVDDRHLTISSPPYEDVWDESLQVYAARAAEDIALETPPGKKIGSICTDLWWYSVVDLEEFKYRFLETGGTFSKFEKYIKSWCDVAEVEPGIYKVDHYFSRDQNKEDGKPWHYAKFTWERAPEPMPERV